MKKSFLSKALVAVLVVLSIFAMAFVVSAEVADTDVAKIGEQGYESLQAAMNEANKAAGNYTITLLKDSAEVFTFAQKSGVNITIDGDTHTFSGKITLNAGGGNLAFTDAKIAPANSQTIYMNASTAPNITFDGCVLQGTNKSGTIVFGYASATSNSITVKNCTADNLQYIVSHRQTGANSVLVENVTATNMIYLIRTLKCPNVTVRNVTCDAVIGIDIKNDGTGKLTLENVHINIYTYNGSLYAPVSGSGAGKSWTVEVKGVNTFSANGVAYEDTSWFSGNAGYKNDIEAQNGSKFGSLADIAKDAKPGDTVKILKETDATVELKYGVTLDKNGFTADNVTVEEPNFVAEIGTQGYETLAEALAVAKDGDVIKLLANNAEEFEFEQNGGKITINGNGFTFTGKITLNAGSGELVITNATLTPSNSAAQTIVLNAATAPNITIDTCTMKNVGTQGAIVWGQASFTSNKVTIKNSTASYLQYLVGANQTGCNNITIENVTATNMAYLIRPMKAANVIVKDVTYSGIVFAEVTVGITTDATPKIFALENVSVNTTHSSLSAILMNAPDSGVSVPYTFTIKGDVVFTKNGVATENWVMVEDSAKCPYVIKNLNGLSGSGTEADPYQIGSIEDLILFRDSVNAGETKYNAPGVYVALTADIDMAGATWERGIGDGINATFDGIFDGKDFTIKNLNLAPQADSDKYFCGGLFGYTYGAAVIKNLVLENITVTADGEGHNVGTLVGFANNNGGKLTISNVTVKNVIIDAPETYGVGAIVGYSYRNMGTIENCTVDGATITGYRFVGGIVGYSYNDAIIIGCNVKNATITGEIGVGGIAGIALPGNNISGNTVTNTTVSAPNNWGYVVGEIAANSFTLGENNNAADPKVGGVWKTGTAVEAKIGNTYYATFADAYAAAWANTYANKGAKQTIYTAAGVKYVELGVWGGIDWTLLTADGTLTIAPTKGTPVADKNAPTKRTYEVGEWRETVIYKSNGSASAIGGAPYDMKAVEKLIIEEGVTSIGSFTCQFPNLTGKVVIPSTVTYIGQEAFHKAPITELIFAESENAAPKLCIANGAFKKILIEEVILPTDREEIHIHHWVFGGCPNLKSAFIPASGTKFWGGEHVDYFDNFNSQTNVSWTESGSIFTGCTKMETITFENEEVRDLFFANGRQSTKEDYIVAYVGANAYNSLQAAINAAQNGETVKLINNVTLTKTLTVPAGKEITLNLNGKTISQSKACTASYEMILNKGILTITGEGKISFTDTSAGDPTFGWGSYTIRNEGTLVVENGTIEHKGAQAFATHMICAIFQYSGSTTINGGTISTPNYRSVRLWKGEMTINGGTFDGQVWVQAVDNSAKLTINDGTFEPNGNDASSVFVSNATYDVAFAVIGGTFNGKIGANDATKLAGAITNGKFNEAAKTGTSEVLYSGYAFGEAADANGYYNLVANVVKNETTGKTYGTLAEAIANATAGQTITFLADITENVTINKSITIDGAGKTYTGTMTVNAGLTVTIQNVNFVNGGIDKPKAQKSTTGSYTIKKCTFNGEGEYAYAFRFYGATSVVIEECAVENYLYSFLYVPSAATTVSVKNVTVEDCPNYAVYFASGVTNATFENLTVKKSNNGFIINNSANRTFTIKNCKMENVGTAIKYNGGTNAITCTISGENNDFGTATISEYAQCVLTEGATLKAVENLKVTTKVDGYIVKYVDGKYILVDAVASVNGVVYNSLQAAIDAANDGETVVLLKDITVTDNDIKMVGSHKVMFNVDGKKITLDLNGKTINVDYNGGQYLIAVIRVADGAGLTVNGNGYINVEENGINVAYMFWKAGTTGYLTIENGYYYMEDSGDSMVYTNGSQIVTIKGGTFVLDTVGLGNNGSPWIFNAAGKNDANIIVTGGSFNADINHQYYCFEVNVSETLSLQYNEETKLWTVVEAVAYIEEIEGNYTHKVGYATFAEALAAAEAGEVIVLLKDLATSVDLEGAILDLNGKTFTGNVLGTVKVNGGLWITAEGFKMIGVGAEYYTSSDAVVNVAANELTIVSGTVTLAQSWRTLPGQNIVVDTDATFVVPANMTFEIYDNTSVVVNGTLTVNGTVELKMGATLKATSGLNVVTNVDGYVVRYIDGTYTVGLPVAEVGGVGYATLAQAIKAATAGQTITLLADINENVTISKNLTIDGNNFKYTGTMTLGAVTATIQKVNFVNGGVDKAKSYRGTTGNYTIKNCTFDGEGKYAYSFRFYGANSVVIEDCSVEDYLYSFLYIPSAAINVSVKNVMVEDCPNYAVYFASGVTNATFENLAVKGSNNGFIINNTEDRNFTIKNCTMENVGTAIKHSDGTYTITVKVLGDKNDFGTATISQYAKCVLTETTATLTAPAGLNIDTDVIGYTVVDNSGVYTVELLNVDVEMTNIRMGETLSHLFAIPFHKNIGTGHVAYINGASFAFKTWTPIKDAEGNILYYVVEYTGIAAKEMTKEVSIYITFGTDKVSAEEDLRTSVQEYAMELLELLKEDTSSDAVAFKTMLVDMLNYGAAAQEYFSYNTETLANAGTEEYQKLATGSYTPCSEHVQDYGNNKHFMGTSVRFENAITLVFKVYLPYTTNVEDITATFVIDGEEVAITTDEVAITTDKTNPYVYYIELKSLVVADAHEDVTCTVKIGDTEIITIKDSVAGYAARRLATEANGGSTDEDARALYSAFMKFADSAINYKANKQ